MVLLVWAVFRGDPHIFSGASGKEPACQCKRCKRCGFHSWVKKILWRRKWQPIPVFLPGESHGQRSLVGYSSWGCKDWSNLVCTMYLYISDKITHFSTEKLNDHVFTVLLSCGSWSPPEVYQLSSCKNPLKPEWKDTWHSLGKDLCRSHLGVRANPFYLNGDFMALKTQKRTRIRTEGFFWTYEPHKTRWPSSLLRYHFRLSSRPWHLLPSRDSLHYSGSPSLHSPHNPGDSAIQMESRAPRWALGMLNDLESGGKGIESVVTSRKCTSIGLCPHYLAEFHLFYSRHQDLKELNPWSWFECKIS